MDMDSTPPAVEQNAEAHKEATLYRLPFKSKERYEQKYSEYCTWKSNNNVRQTTEDVFIKYLAERSNVINPATLWSEQSMLTIMIKLRERINIKQMNKVKCFMKQNRKNYTPKKSRTLTDKECMQFLKDAPDDIYLMMKIALIIGIHGACRRSEMTEFEVEHLTFCDDYLVLTIPKTQKLFPRTFTVPNSRDGVPMAELVKKYIALRPAHTPHKRLFIFYGKGKCSINPVGINTFSKIPANIAQFLNLPDAKLYTGLCFRRTSKAANVLTNSGCWNSSTVTNQANVEETDEEMNYEAQLRGSSSSSPSVQDIVMSTLRTMEPKEGEEIYNAENDERISLILDRKLSFLPEQVPLKIADDEYKVMNEMICNEDVFRDATLLTKVHCTVCDTHLGTAPVAQFDRFVHPVLNTLLCESCCMSYNEREFLKDEDGIEVYCKWCGQGGTVMCCSDCPLVFCKVCVDRNFGERGWEKIDNSDTWQCFKCNPRQLSKLQIMCAALHEYTLKTIEYAIQRGDKDLLEKDISICCKEDSTTINKRKHIVLDDEDDLEDDMPIAALRKRMNVCHDLNESLSIPDVILADMQSAPPTLERPATPEMQPVIPTVQLQDLKSPATSNSQNVLSLSNASNINPPVQRIILPKISLPASAQSPPLVADISLPLPSQCTEIFQDQAPLKPGMPVITRVEGNVVLPTLPSTKESITKTEKRTSKYVLLKNSVDETQEVIGTLTRQCEYMRLAMKKPKSDAGYAELQYSMQDALYQCVCLLLETRNVLTNSNANPKQVPKKVPARVPSAANKTAVTSVDGAAGKKSTIICKNYVPAVLTPLRSRSKDVNQRKRVLPKPTLTPVTVRTTQNTINTNSAIKTTGLKPPVPMNQIQPPNTVRHVNSNMKNNSIVISQVGSKTVGNIVPSSMVSDSKKNMYDMHVMDVNKTKTADKDPLAMSDDESEGSLIESDIDIDVPIMVKVEEDETYLY